MPVPAMTVGSVMTRTVHTVPAGTTLPSAASQLVEAGVRRLFVTEHDRLVGVLSRRDLFSTYLREDDAIRADVEQVVAVANRLGYLFDDGDRPERRNPCVSET